MVQEQKNDTRNSLHMKKSFFSEEELDWLWNFGLFENSDVEPELKLTEARPCRGFTFGSVTCCIF